VIRAVSVNHPRCHAVHPPTITKPAHWQKRSATSTTATASEPIINVENATLARCLLVERRRATRRWDLCGKRSRAASCGTGSAERVCHRRMTTHGVEAAPSRTGPAVASPPASASRHDGHHQKWPYRDHRPARSSRRGRRSPNLSVSRSGYPAYVRRSDCQFELHLDSGSVRRRQLRRAALARPETSPGSPEAHPIRVGEPSTGQPGGAPSSSSASLRQARLVGSHARRLQPWNDRRRARRHFQRTLRGQQEALCDS
jgi:hypothetical protein